MAYQKKTLLHTLFLIAFKIVKCLQCILKVSIATLLKVGTHIHIFMYDWYKTLIIFRIRIMPRPTEAVLHKYDAVELHKSWFFPLYPISEVLDEL